MASKGRRAQTLAGIAAIGAAALMLAACTGGGSGDDGQVEGDPESGSITWWGWTPTDTATAERYIAAFNEEYPDIEVEFKLVGIPDWDAVLRPALLSGEGPDVFELEPGARVEQFGDFGIDMTPIAEEALGDDWQSQLASVGVSGLLKDDVLTSMPVGSTYAGMLWINQEIFDEFDLEPPTTLDEWVEVCATFDAGGQGCFVQGAAGQGFNQDTLQSIANSVEPGLWSAASQGEAEWNDPGIVETFEIWKRLFDDGIMQPGAVGYAQYPDANNDFLTGKYAMVMMGTWYTQYTTVTAMTDALSAAGVSDAEPFTMVPIAFPDVAGNGNPDGMFGDANFGLAINSDSDQQAAATTFVTWLTTSTVGQQAVADQLNDYPSLIGISPNFDEITLVNPDVQESLVQALIQKVADVDEPRFALISADAQQAMQEAAQAVATGDLTPQEAADKFQETVAAGF